jgi:hypothetical protein
MIRRLVILTVTIVLASGKALAQVATGAPPFATIEGGPFDTVVKFAQKYQMRNRILAKSLPALR